MCTPLVKSIDNVESKSASYISFGVSLEHDAYIQLDPDGSACVWKGVGGKKTKVEWEPGRTPGNEEGPVLLLPYEKSVAVIQNGSISMRDIEGKALWADLVHYRLGLPHSSVLRVGSAIEVYCRTDK